MSAREATVAAQASNMFSAMRASPSAFVASRRSEASRKETCGEERQWSRRHCAGGTRRWRARGGGWQAGPRRRGASAEPLGSAREAPACEGREETTSLRAKEGFSVVAPMSTRRPCSTYGRKMSCCFLLKRWISSMNRTVGTPFDCRSLAAWAATSRMSWTPAVQHESVRNGQDVWWAMMEAIVVFPHPGGPKRIIEGGGSRWSSVRIAAFSPKTSMLPYIKEQRDEIP